METQELIATLRNEAMGKIDFLRVLRNQSLPPGTEVSYLLRYWRLRDGSPRVNAVPLRKEELAELAGQILEELGVGSKNPLTQPLPDIDEMLKKQ